MATIGYKPYSDSFFTFYEHIDKFKSQFFTFEYQTTANVTVPGQKGTNGYGSTA